MEFGLKCYLKMKKLEEKIKKYQAKVKYYIKYRTNILE